MATISDPADPDVGAAPAAARRFFIAFAVPQRAAPVWLCGLTPASARASCSNGPSRCFFGTACSDIGAGYGTARTILHVSVCCSRCVVGSRQGGLQQENSRALQARGVQGSSLERAAATTTPAAAAGMFSPVPTRMVVQPAIAHAPLEASASSFTHEERVAVDRLCKSGG